MSETVNAREIAQRLWDGDYEDVDDMVRHIEAAFGAAYQQGREDERRSWSPFDIAAAIRSAKS